MNPFHSIWSRLRSLAQQREAKREIDEELRFHLEQRIAENITAGMSPEQAQSTTAERAEDETPIVTASATHADIVLSLDAILAGPAA